MSDVRPPGSIRSFGQSARSDANAPESESLSIVRLLRGGTLDPDLAGLLWLLIEGRVPVIVAAGPQNAGKTTLLNALLAFLPPTAAVHELAGYEENFAWLADAARLGWRPDQRRAADLEPGRSREPLLAPSSGYLVASELSPHLPWYTWGEQARVAVRALSLGYGLGATIHADSLQEVLDALRAPDVRLTDDELSQLGIVLVLRAFRNSGGSVVRRVAAAHYVRPISRDAGGHVQRLSPAVMTTWDPATDAFEHFSWGITSELAGRIGRSAGEFETEHARRRDVLEALAAAGVESNADVRSAIDGYRLAGTGHRH